MPLYPLTQEARLLLLQQEQQVSNGATCGVTRTAQKRSGGASRVLRAFCGLASDRISLPTSL
jgi:hypothetical protein